MVFSSGVDEKNVLKIVGVRFEQNSIKIIICARF